MNFVLREVMNIPIMNGAKILNKNDFTREITGITIMEAPDIADWIKEGQILLARFSNVEKLQHTGILSKLADKKIGALFVKNKEDNEIPRNFIEECHKNKINLIEIPKEISYTSITYPVMQKLFNMQLERANYFIESHNIFMQIALNNKGLKEILIELSKILKKGIIFLDKDEKILYNFSKYKISTNDNLEIIGKEPCKNEGNLCYFQRILKTEDNEIEGFILPIKVLDNTGGLIFIEKSENEFLDEIQQITLESVSTVIKLELLKEFTIQEMIRKNKNELIDEILFSESGKSEEIKTKANIMGWNFDKTYYVCIFKIYKKYAEYNKIYDIDKEIEKISYGLRSIVSKYTENTASDHIIRAKNDKIILLLNVKDDMEIYKIIKTIYMSFKEKVEQKYKITEISAGIGEKSEDISGISRSYKEAEEALKLGEVIEGKGNIRYFKDLGIYRLLCNYGDTNSLKEFIPSPLVKLVKYDKESNNNLLNTLEVLLKCDCNASKASQELFIHYKTLLYRMNKIKSIMEIDFMQYENRLSIEVGMKILKILENGNN